MLETILNPNAFLGILIAGALATPLLALAVWKTRAELRARWLAAAGASGPGVLLLWGAHNLVLETVGFASVWSLAIVVAGAAAIGTATGIWIRRDPRGQRGESR